MLTLKAKYQVGDYVAAECGGQIVFVEVMEMRWKTEFIYTLSFPKPDDTGCLRDYPEELIIGRINPSAIAKFRKPVVEETRPNQGRWDEGKWIPAIPPVKPEIEPVVEEQPKKLCVDYWR